MHIPPCPTASGTGLELLQIPAWEEATEAGSMSSTSGLSRGVGNVCQSLARGQFRRWSDNGRSAAQGGYWRRGLWWQWCGRWMHTPMWYTMWYTMSYTIVYTMVYTMVYDMVYHMVYHMGVCIHLPHHCHQSPRLQYPPCAALLPLSLQRLNCPLARLWQTFPTPLLSPEVELIEPASVASSHAGICSSSSPVPEAVGQGGMCIAAYVARHQWHTS